MTRVVKVATIAQAARALVEHRDAGILAGGTGLQVEWMNGGRRPSVLVDVSRIEDAAFRAIGATGIGVVTIGAGVCLADVESDAGIPALVRRAAASVAAPQVRGLATSGGNVAGRTGCLIPALFCLEAQAEWHDGEDARVEPLTHWLSRPAGTGVLVRLHLRRPPADALLVWRKIGYRRAFTPSAIVIAGIVERDPAGRVSRARIAAGGGANPAKRLGVVEAALEGRSLDTIDWRALRNLAARSLETASDAGRSSRYRRNAAANALVFELGGERGSSAIAPVRPTVPRMPVPEAAPAGERRLVRDPAAPDWHVRADMRAKIEGTYPFHTDARSPDMLVGRILRAGVAHARILSIDTRAARALPGVAAVVTAADVPGDNRFGIVVQDQPALCSDKVRYAGDAIAAVSAVDARTAARALELIRVEYEPLPLVDDPDAALGPDAPAVHDGGNLRRELTMGRGDVDAAFAVCAHVVEETYRTPRQMHAFMETEGGYAVPHDDDTLTVCVGSQYGARDRLQLARILGCPPETIRVVSGPTGGAFGGKDELTVQPALALLAKASGRPVRMHLDRSESVLAGWKSMPFRIRMRTGCDARGVLLAQSLDVVADCGAYCSLSPGVLETALEHLAGPYVIENVRSRGRLVYTNNGVCGAFRGFGANQMTFAVESQIDRLAALAGLDPIAMRRRNLRRSGSPGFLGQIAAPSERLEEVLTAAAASDLWQRPRGISADGRHVIGVGMALNYQGNGIGSIFEDPIAGHIALAPDGKIEARFDLVEMGQGLASVVQEAVADALGCARADVRPVLGDTDIGLDGGSTTASRGSVAVWLAAQGSGPALARALIDEAVDILGRPADRLAIGPGGIRDLGANAEEGPALGFAALAAALGPAACPEVTHRSDFPKADWPRENARFFYCYGTTLARVAVDRATGEVDVLDLDLHTAAGPVIDTAGYLGQIEGGMGQALGFSLSEHMRLAAGLPVTRNFDSYFVPTPVDAPASSRVFALEDLDPGDRYGPRGVGELGMGAVTPALANAIADALGTWPATAPFSPEHLLAVMGGLAPEEAS